jgi:Histidine kinase-, DNA gyrase B-, and HSP90-like ATPase
MTEAVVEMSARVLTDARKRPMKALAEAIWNALDVGADHVTVDFEFTELEALKTITVADDGEGMSLQQARQGFGEYGDSWKRRIDARTHNGRSVHGQRGQGRYDILHLGQSAKWSSVATQIDGSLGLIEVDLQATNPRSYDDSGPTPHDGPTGTTLRVANVTQQADTELNRPELTESLAADFALYLRQYPDVEIRVRGVLVDPSSQHLPPVDIPLSIEGLDDPATVTFIEWKKKLKGTQHIYLCDGNGAALLDRPAELPSRDILFTAYVCWDGFKDQDTSATVAILGGDGLGAKVLEAGRDAVREHLRQRDLERRAEAVEDFKAEQSYPFEAEPKNAPERVIRKAFDIVATAATPVLEKMDVEQRRFSMKLMRVAVETDPSAVQKVLREVLRLPEERIQEMASLFERTTLENIITSSHSILNRLDFLAGLRTIVFDAEAQKATTERRQLHKILERESWLFGDEWTLTASDETLRRVLVKHLVALGEDVEYADAMPQSQAEGSVLIPDLVLSASASSYSKSREYLVVELKRPALTLGKAELDQIEAYAIAITEDIQFNQVEVTWTFWLIGKDYNNYVDLKLRTHGNPRGCALIAPNYRIFVRSWAEVLDDAEHRHQYLKDALAATSDEDAGLEYLNRVHRDLIPDVVKRPASDGLQEDQAGADTALEK